MNKRYKCKLCGTECLEVPCIGSVCMNDDCENEDGILGREPKELFEEIGDVSEVQNG